MNFSVDPTTFQSMKIETEKEQKHFLFQLTTLFRQIIAAFSMVSVSASNLVLINKSLGTVGTNQAVNCANAAIITINLTISAGLTLTLNNVPLGIPVFIQVLNSAGTASTFTLAATTPTGASYTTIATKVPGAGSGGFTTNWITGVGLGSGLAIVICLQGFSGPILQGFHA